MSINLMDLMKDQLGGAVLGQVGKHLGMDEKTANTGMGAILPTVLGGLMKQASTPSGAESLNNSLDNDFDGGLLDKLPDMLGGGGNSSMMSNLGATVLKSLFGDKIASIVGILSKATGIGSDKSGSLLTMLAPLVMSVLGKHKQSAGLDAGGLAGLLMGQKDSIAKAMPAGMGDTLGIAGLGGGSSRPAATAPAHTPRETSGGGGGLMKILIPLIILGLLGFAAFKMLGGPAPELPNVPAVPDVDLAVPDVDVPDVGMSLPEVGDISGKLNGVFDGYKDTLTGITDEASAKEAVPKLEDLNGDLGGLSSMLNKLPEGAQSAVTGKLGPMLEPINGIIEKLYAIPGVQAILEPVVNSMLEKVKGLTGG